MTTTPAPKTTPRRDRSRPSAPTRPRPVYQQLRAHLATLKLHDAAEAPARASWTPPAAEKLVHDRRHWNGCCAIEVDATEARRLAGRLRFACLPTPASLDDFDYDAAPGIDRPPASTNSAPAATWRPRPTCC